MKVALALLALLALVFKEQQQNVNAADVPCPVDLVFVMDSSGSMRANGWAAAKAFANRIVDAVPMGNDKAQFAFVQFGDSVGTVFNLNTYTNAADLKTAINGVPGPGGWTQTHLGLNKANEILFSAAHGARASADKLVILLTDGQSSNPTQALASAATLRARGVKIVAVGAGPSIDVAELEGIAGVASQVLQTTNVATVHQDQFIHDQIKKHLDCTNVRRCPVDLVFVMDSSGSMRANGWAAAKAFANRIVDAVPMGNDKAQFAFVQFSSSVGTVFNLNTYTNAADLKTAINGVTGASGETQTHLGLNKANEILFSAAHGARASAEKLVILLTDGQSHNPTQTLASAATLRARGVKIVAVGAGRSIDVAELQGIAGVASQVLQTTDVATVHQDQFIHDQIKKHLDCTSVRRCPVDLAFVMDSSGSMRANGWAAAKAFANRIVDAVPMGNDKARFAFVQFSSYVGTVYKLNRYTNAADLKTAINRVRGARGMTLTHKGLNKANEILFSAAHGARAFADKLVILLTDGRSSLRTQALASAATLRARGVKIVAVGAGPSIDLAELQDIAGVASQVLQTTDVATVHQDQFIHDQIKKHLDCATNVRRCPVDLVFVIDSSGSMRTNGWAAAKAFANRIVDAVPMGNDKAQFAFVQFSSSVGTVFNLNTYTNAADLKTAINGVSGPGGGTQTHLGLNKARELLFSAAHGARASADKLVILLTDGRSGNPTQALASAATLRARGVKIVAVGAGPNIDVAELEGIAGVASQVLQTTDVATVHQDQFIHDQIKKHLDCTDVRRCPVDLVFVMDSSSSMETNGWAAAKAFANRIVNAVPMGNDEAQFAFVQFSHSVGTVFNLNTYTNAASLRRAINRVRGPRGWTLTHLGLNKANEILFSAAHGARASADKLVILLTDGQSGNPTQALASAATLRARGVKIVAVGAGPSIDVTELQGIAGVASQVLQTTNVDIVHQDQFIHDQIKKHLDCTGASSLPRRPITLPRRPITLPRRIQAASQPRLLQPNRLVSVPVEAPVWEPVEAPVGAPVEAPAEEPVEAPVEAPVGGPEQPVRQAPSLFLPSQLTPRRLQRLPAAAGARLRLIQ